MKVLDLRCANGHSFEGWFSSDEDFMDQNGRSMIECPLCGDSVITRMLSAPRLNLSGAREPAPAKPPAPTAPPQPADMQANLQAAWFATVRHLMSRTEDVGTRFAEEARRIHNGEAPPRAIRGHATPEEREALLEEGIETLAIPVPRALEGPLQ